MNRSVTYTEIILSRAAGFCAGQRKKTLIVGAGAALKAAAGYVQNLSLQDHVDLSDATDLAADHAPLEADPAYGAVFTASENPKAMQVLRRLCARYQGAGVPVLALTGWPPPMNAAQFRFQSDLSGNLTIPAMFDLAARFCGGTAGDYFEFGTFLGYTLQCAYHAFGRRSPGTARRFIAFDSFAGIVGARADEMFTDGAYAASIPSFRFANFLAEVPDDRVLTVEGPYQQTLLGERAAAARRMLGETQAAVVHIDCDVEEPAKLALDFVTPYVKQGTLLLFDEFDLHRADNSKGERAALRAWLAENPRFEVELYRGYHVHAKAFILHER